MFSFPKDLNDVPLSYHLQIYSQSYSSKSIQHHEFLIKPTYQIRKEEDLKIKECQKEDCPEPNYHFFEELDLQKQYERIVQLLDPKEDNHLSQLEIKEKTKNYSKTEIKSGQTEDKKEIIYQKIEEIKSLERIGKKERKMKIKESKINTNYSTRKDIKNNRNIKQDEKKKEEKESEKQFETIAKELNINHVEESPKTNEIFIDKENEIITEINETTEFHKISHFNEINKTINDVLEKTSFIGNDKEKVKVITQQPEEKVIEITKEHNTQFKESPGKYKRKNNKSKKPIKKRNIEIPKVIDELPFKGSSKNVSNHTDLKPPITKKNKKNEKTDLLSQLEQTWKSGVMMLIIFIVLFTALSIWNDVLNEMMY
ncbi:hypothetical protein, conserved [Entamoeba dispar SAW760]|uniref:Uncharacterized protein n=1 Tax=Entamoeba dispar (strain ATCC PRA-260 / SAW760) TaxID=370354 RepID=B0E769_ENTDS|nr:uncharacterized protein EDI_285770 [Entamoeba dispar SAW760]EDR29640.1 hypothetical protein, conserved [Entamoeba dispar SAW760]|eukprot:EDR29640.1 hypothetical protein, conserved [Entamoeba dispar SAW760]